VFGDTKQGVGVPHGMPLKNKESAEGLKGLNQ